MKDLTVYLVKQIVSPDCEFSVDEQALEDGSLKINVLVPKEEMGRVIGKNGKIIQALRTLVNSSAAKQNLRVTLSLSEPTV